MTENKLPPHFEEDAANADLPPKTDQAESEFDLFENFEYELWDAAGALWNDRELKAMGDKLKMAMEIIMDMLKKTLSLLEAKHKGDGKLMRVIAELAGQFLRDKNSADRVILGEELIGTTYSGKLAAALKNNGFLVTGSDFDGYANASVEVREKPF